jgi:hypothetical protein
MSSSGRIAPKTLVTRVARPASVSSVSLMFCTSCFEIWRLMV